MLEKLLNAFAVRTAADFQHGFHPEAEGRRWQSEPLTRGAPEQAKAWGAGM